MSPLALFRPPMAMLLVLLCYYDCAIGATCTSAMVVPLFHGKWDKEECQNHKAHCGYRGCPVERPRRGRNGADQEHSDFR